MAEDGQDASQKTEEPTQRRLEEARKEGQVTQSREVSNFLLLLTFTLIIAWMMPGVMKRITLILVPFLRDADEFVMDEAGVSFMLSHVAWGSFLVMMVPLLLLAVAGIASGLMQHGANFTWKPVTPKFSKISPLAGFKRLFSMRSVMEMLKGVLKITIVGVVGFMSVYPELVRVRQLPDDDVQAMLFFLSTLATKLMVGICVAMFFIALFDYLYQRYEFMKSMRMSRQELKDEYKQQEGDPIVKQKLRQMRMERARKRMMAAVPKADVVITNPTHYAVALQYDTKTMKAPKVVAKGLDFIALNIRRIAEENKVTIVENPPLARALYDNVEVDEEIKAEHYKAVAEVISYVYRLKGKIPREAQPKTAL